MCLYKINSPLIDFFLSFFDKQCSNQSAKNIELFLRQNKDPLIKDLASVSERHLKRKDTLLETFLGYLFKDKYFKKLQEKVEDMDEPGTLVSTFILRTRWPKHKTMFTILKRALIYFVQNHKMYKARFGSADIQLVSVEYQPTTWDTMLKSLFPSLGKYGVLYKHPNDISNVWGSYIVYLDHKYAIIAKSRSDFGSLQNRSAIVPQSQFSQ